MRHAALALAFVVPLLAAAASAQPPHVTVFSIEGSLQTEACVQIAGLDEDATCARLLPGSRVIIPLASLNAPGTPFHWSGNISWGSLPTSDTFQVALMGNVSCTTTVLHTAESGSPVAFHYRLHDYAHASALALHIHGVRFYEAGILAVGVEHRQTFFVDGVVLSA